ncbi:MAG TPA: hypothetical protein VHU44_08125 [Acidobacteriaceae bacterium]|jgi:hypothetical protein|nr:hypothetical protein [Acidobacteriaceae bacterium]
MHPEPLINPEDTLHPEDHTRIARDAADRALDARIVSALEQAPPIHIPQDFAARVASRIPARTARLRADRIPARRVPVRHVGYTVAAACLIALAVAMLALAPHSTHNTFYVALDSTLAAQFCLLAAWLALPRRQ